MKDRFKSALNRIEVEEELVTRTEAHLRKAFAHGQHSRTNIIVRRLYEMKRIVLKAK